MPVKSRGKQIVEVSTGKVVGRSKDAAMAKKAVQARNIAHAKKAEEIMEAIDYLTVDELITELQKGHEALIVVGLKDLDTDRCVYLFMDSGGLVRCLGLAEYASTKIRHNIIEFESDRQNEAEEVEF